MTTIRLALCGASGTGKSTIATDIAKRFCLPICPTGSREIAKQMGFASPYDVDAAGKRAEFQQRLFSAKRDWENDHATFVTDRSYLDNLAYTCLHAPTLAKDTKFMSQVFDAMGRYTHLVFCPLGAFQDIGDDPARVSDAAYHRKYEDHLVKLLQGHGILGQLPPLLWLTTSDHDERVARVERFVRS